MMSRFTRVLAGLLRWLAGLLPAGRRDWAEAVLGEAGDAPAGPARVAWLGGGLWLVAREIVLHRAVRVLAFAAGAVGMVWIGWPGTSSDSAVPVNRMYVAVTLVLLAAAPWVVGRYFGPVRGGWAPRAARVGGYALVLALIAAKAARARYGDKLGAYFAFVPGIWALEVVLLLVIAGYVAVLLILTAERARAIRPGMPAWIGIGVITALMLYAFAPLGEPYHPPARLARWYGPASTLSWWLAALAVPLATGFVAARFAARGKRPEIRTLHGCVAAMCALSTAALLLAVLTLVTIVLLPHHVPLQNPPPPPGGGCETCDPNSVVIPPGLRHEYWADLSVSQAGMQIYAALLIAPILGAWVGGLGAQLAGRSPGTRRRGGDLLPRPSPHSFKNEGRPPAPGAR
jgi:hypothetical protein